MEKVPACPDRWFPVCRIGGVPAREYPIRLGCQKVVLNKKSFYPNVLYGNES